MSVSRSPRPALAVLVALVATACASGGTAHVGTSSAPATAGTPITTHPARAAAGVLDTASLGASFDLPMRVDVPSGWLTQLPPSIVPARTLNILHGDPGQPMTWWGPSFDLVDGASVLDPAKLAATDHGSGAKTAWPASYLDYLAALPGVTVVDGPSPVTIGGVRGRAITVTTPVMPPTIWLKDDYTWLGGGASGIDPAFERRYVELTVGGKRLLIEYLDLPSAFDGRVGAVDALLGSIEFPG